jgi:uncharacterized protein
VFVSSHITPKARKGAASAIQGRGLVAVAPIVAGELVAIKGGHTVTTATLQSLPERLQNSEIQIADGFHLAALEDAEYEPVMLFINHSCEPNVGFAGNTVLVAMRDIGPGEELTTDHALFDDHDETMACRCGTPSCRGMSAAGLAAPRPAAQIRRVFLLLPAAPADQPARPAALTPDAADRLVLFAAGVLTTGAGAE